ncbi:hypothetical protein VTK56DRAFT_331 [Thermocarpiscus australiensis]
MSTGQAPPTTQALTPHYQHQQAPTPLLPPGPTQYPPTQYGSQYGYANGLATTPTGPPVSNSMAVGQPVLPLPSVQPAMGPNSYSPGFDTTGQIQPPGVKPRVTATLWEDEGSLCFQVEARGICVARREDNHMINGTKLLNVAGMTRGRRDGILKSEKIRHVVKIGPMHLKGVWIPFDRALDFANKEKITELLYPLFVHNIGSLLCHPTNQTRASQVMAAAQRKQESMRAGQGAPGLPSLQHHHQLALPGPQPPLPSHPHPTTMGRPSLDRAHTFPTPPASASSVMGGMGASENFQWNQQGMSNGQANGQISIDTSGTLSNNSRSLPNTPATSPPGSTIQSMQNYPAASNPYDNSRQMYQTAPSQPSGYPSSNSASQERPMYGHANFAKSDMAPPSSRPAGPGGEQVDGKPPNGVMHAGQNEAVPATGGEEEAADHEHDAAYTHDSGAYDANRSSYNYSAPPVASIPNDHSHLSPDMSGSPHQAGSVRSTPRTAPNSYFAAQGYHTPPRVGHNSSNLYNVMSNDRAPTNGATGSDPYGSQSDMTGSMQNGYATQSSVMNGNSAMKRGRDDDDDRQTSDGAGMALDLKRRKTMMEGGGSMPSSTFNSTVAQQTSAVGAQRRR